MALPEDPEVVVRRLPIWRGIKAVTPLKGGVSNAAFVIDDHSGRFVARIGADYPFHQVSRSREAEAHRAAHAAGLSPNWSMPAMGQWSCATWLPAPMARPTCATTGSAALI